MHRRSRSVPSTWILFGIASIAVAVSQPQRAGAQRSVLLVSPSEADAPLADAFNRLEAELHIHGFETRRQAAEVEPPSAAGLRELAQSTGSIAAFAFVRRDGASSLEIVVFDGDSGEPSTHSLPLERGRDTASLIAVRAVDLLRASLQEFPREPEPVVQPPPPPPPTPSVETPPPMAAPIVVPRWSITAEGALIWPGDRLGVGFGPALGVFYRPVAWFGWGVWLSGPVVGTKLETASGSATVRQELGFVEARFMPLRAGRFELGPLAACGVYLLQASGNANEPLQSRDDAVWSPLVAVGLRAQQGVSDHFAVAASARALALLPGVGVAVARERAAVSLPALQVALGVAVGF